MVKPIIVKAFLIFFSIFSIAHAEPKKSLVKQGYAFLDESIHYNYRVQFQWEEFSFSNLSSSKQIGIVRMSIGHPFISFVRQTPLQMIYSMSVVTFQKNFMVVKASVTSEFEHVFESEQVLPEHFYFVVDNHGKLATKIYKDAKLTQLETKVRFGDLREDTRKLHEIAATHTTMHPDREEMILNLVQGKKPVSEFKRKLEEFKQQVDQLYSQFFYPSHEIKATHQLQAYQSLLKLLNNQAIDFFNGDEDLRLVPDDEWQSLIRRFEFMREAVDGKWEGKSRLDPHVPF